MAYSNTRVLRQRMVLAKDESLPPMRWPPGRVLNLINSKNGVSRVSNHHLESLEEQ